MGRDVVPSTPGAAYADPSDAGGFAKAPAVPKVKDWERCFEFLATVTTGVLFLSRALKPPVVFIATSVVLWLLWAIFQCRRYGKGVLFLWGLRIDCPNLKYSFICPSIFAILAMVFICVGTVTQGHSIAVQNWRFWLVLVIYPFWGVFIQVLLQSMLMRHLNWFFTGSDEDGVLDSLGKSRAVCCDKNSCWYLWGSLLTIPSSSIAFLILHSSDGWLMAFHGVMGMVWVVEYWIHQNVQPLGLYHGLLGTMFYFWFMGRDPLNIMFSTSQIG